MIYRRVLAVAAYLLGFHCVYRIWINPVYGYLGFPYPESVSASGVAGYILSVVTVLWLPSGIKRVSQFLSWMLYVIVYLPSLQLIGFDRVQSDRANVALQLTLTLGLAMICGASNVRLIRVANRSIGPKAFWMLFLVALGLLVIRTSSVFWGHFQLVAWDKTYGSIRSSGSDLAASAGLVYPITWLAVVFFPIIATVGLLTRRYWLFVLSIAGDVFLYATQGMKHVLFAGIYILSLYVIIRRHERHFGTRLLAATALFFIGFAAYVFAFDAAYSPLVTALGVNVILRVFAIPGMLMVAYDNFFRTHPFTYFSHISVVAPFVQYPYQHSIGIELGIATARTTDYNMNASFWATDGIAACGLWGVIIISCIVAFVFYLIDCVSARHWIVYSVLMLSQYAIVLANISFFTSVVTGGLWLFFLIFYISPRFGDVDSAKRLIASGMVKGA